MLTETTSPSEAAFSVENIHVSDSDLPTFTDMPFEDIEELHLDHPGASDQEYRTRRDYIASLSKKFRETGVITDVDYNEQEQGIRQAIESGLLAADTIVAARGQFAVQRLEPYVAGMAARCGTASVSGAVARLVPDAVKAVVAGRLLRVPAFVRRVVIDDWFLHSRQPALAR